MSREVKIGIFLCISILILATFIFIVGDMSTLFFKGGYPLYLYFDSAAGLEKRTVLRMAGVKVGYVKDIRLKDGRAEVLLSVDPEIKVPTDSKATLAALGILGEKYIEILPGEGPNFCEPGASIDVISPISLDQLGIALVAVSNEVKETGKMLRELIGSEESREQVEKILHNLALFSEDLHDLTNANKQPFKEGLLKVSGAVDGFDQKVKDISENLEELISLLRSVVEENRGNLKANLEDFRALIDEADKTLEQLDKSIGKVSNGEGTLGQLIQKPELYTKAEETLEEIGKLVKPVSSFRVYAGMRFDYFASPNLVKSHLTFSLWPTPSKFLLTQITRDPWASQFTYSLQGGARWGGISPRAGIMESEVGAAVDVYLFKDRLKFSLESFDFNRRPYPHYRVFSRYAASKYLYLLFGLDDIALRDRIELFFGLGLGI